MDVEGFEAECVKGAQRTLAEPGLMAVIMELTGQTMRYGSDKNSLLHEMQALGFRCCRYDPGTRKLRPVPGLRVTDSGNALFVRNIAEVASRVANAPQFAIGLVDAVV